MLRRTQRTKVPTDQEPSPRPRLRLLRSKGTGARKGADAPVRVRVGRAHNLIGQIRRIQVSPLFPLKIRARGAGWDWARFENVMYQLLVDCGSQPQSSRQTGCLHRYPVLRTPSRQANGQGVRPILQLRVLASTSSTSHSRPDPSGTSPVSLAQHPDGCRGTCPRKSCPKCFHRRLKQRAPLSTPCGARYLSVPHPPRLG